MKRRIALVSLFSLLAAAVVVTYSVPSASAFVFGPGASASGHGNIDQGGDLRTFSFHAREGRGGAVTGSVTLHNRQSDTFIKADIDCMVISGNIARMSGRITKSSNEAFEGATGIFQVEDNGEGANSPPDGMSLFAIFAPTSTADCNNTGAPILLPIEGGNVQVKP